MLEQLCQRWSIDKNVFPQIIHLILEQKLPFLFPVKDNIVKRWESGIGIPHIYIQRAIISEVQENICQTNPLDFTTSRTL